MGVYRGIFKEGPRITQFGGVGQLASANRHHRIGDASQPSLSAPQGQFFGHRTVVGYQGMVAAAEPELNRENHALVLESAFKQAVAVAEFTLSIREFFNFSVRPSHPAQGVKAVFGLHAVSPYVLNRGRAHESGNQ